MLAPGTVLVGRYTIGGILGRGGMGAVYQAVTPDGREVAVKEMIIDADPHTEDSAIRQFHREASLLARLSHPNLVAVYETFEEHACHYLVMELIRGSSLRDLDPHVFVPIGTVLGWMEQLCDVLGYMHAQQPPILFRDLKPGNVMLDGNGRVRLIDFGLARTGESGSQTTTFIKGAGTSGYAALEQYGTDTTDWRTDIYALGATLYTLLTHQVPPTAVEMVGEDLTPARDINPAVPPALDDLILRMMAPAKRDRPQSMAEVRDALRLLEGGPTGPAPGLGAASPITTRVMPVNDDPTQALGPGML